MNIDLAGTGIRVSMISPGAVRTEFSEVRFHGDREAAAKVYEGYTPLSAANVAEAVFFIINAPPHVNIQNILITPTFQRNRLLRRARRQDLNIHDRPGSPISPVSSVTPRPAA